MNDSYKEDGGGEEASGGEDVGLGRRPVVVRRRVGSRGRWWW